MSPGSEPICMRLINVQKFPLQILQEIKSAIWTGFITLSVEEGVQIEIMQNYWLTIVYIVYIS